MARNYTIDRSASAAGGGESSSIDYKAELNEQQFQAVTSLLGQSLVIAGAGSGKPAP